MFKLNRNMGTMDRVTRTLVGSALLITGPLTDLMETDTLSNVLLGGLGAIAILSAAFSYCFLYEVTGFNTCRKQG